MFGKVIVVTASYKIIIHFTVYIGEHCSNLHTADD
jgi:hypothetical protein